MPRNYTATPHPPTPSPSRFAFGEGEKRSRKVPRPAASLMERDCRFALGEGCVVTMPLPRINPLYVFVTLCEYRVSSRALTLRRPPYPNGASSPKIVGKNSAMVGWIGNVSIMI